MNIELWKSLASIYILLICPDQQCADYIFKTVSIYIIIIFFFYNFMKTVAPVIHKK